MWGEGLVYYFPVRQSLPWCQGSPKVMLNLSELPMDLYMVLRLGIIRFYDLEWSVFLWNTWLRSLVYFNERLWCIVFLLWSSNFVYFVFCLYISIQLLLHLTWPNYHLSCNNNIPYTDYKLWYCEMHFMSYILILYDFLFVYFTDDFVGVTKTIIDVKWKRCEDAK